MNVSDALSRLHFHPLWLESGLLDLDWLLHQAELYRQSLKESEDEELWFWNSLEHHRYAAFVRVLRTRSHLTHSEIENYLALCRLDEDQGMATSAAIGLLQSQFLTDDQLKFLAKRPEFDNDLGQRQCAMVLKNREERRLHDAWLQVPGPSELEFLGLFQGGENTQRGLLNRANLTRSQLGMLAGEGATRAIRRAAHKRLQP